MRTAQLLLVAATALPTAHVAAPPVVYWSSSPTLANETLLVAGAGLGGASAQLCSDAACASKITSPSAAVAWEQSLKLVLPLTIAAPLFLQISPAAGSLPLTLAVNAPDIWWVISGRPGTMRNGSFERDAMHPSWLNTSVTLGDPVRVFGRSLAWDSSSAVWTCIGAAEQPSAVPSTKLTVAGVTVASASANCFEATFPTDGMAPGTHQATLSTPWGPATSFGLTILAKSPPSASTRIDVNTVGFPLFFCDFQWENAEIAA